MDSKPEHNPELTEEDLLAFMAGEASAELRKRIADEMEREGSFTQQWLHRVQSAAADPFNVDWAKLLESEGMRNRGSGSDGGRRKR